MEMEANIENLPRIWAQKGEDWEEMLELQARVLRKTKDLEEQYDIEFSKPKTAVGQQPPSENPSDADESSKKSLSVIAGGKS